jgi:hypothetical protein
VLVDVGGGSVGVMVAVAVCVAVSTGVGAAATTSGLLRTANKTITAPIARKSANKAIAAGILNVISGIRLPCKALAGLVPFSVLPTSAPHTRQRTASSLRRVPHVGHNLVAIDEDSGLISLFVPVVTRIGALYQCFRPI